ncbi:Cyclic nucleotide-gated cation channel beta-1 [Hypsibius exemplaris]|uniref:Cyclic nucleotide-gated cation channel beta-1 n=1 Tax=Hypsibius exemplaris TaxID=2072580 RepID=A0A1W0XFT6_HYPEX|nr:Cyclic nucleotide-gated cation channel beta-1 [Hypsibius exemplaris]
MASSAPAFPAPAPSTVPISTLAQDDSDGDLNLDEVSQDSERRPSHQFVNVVPAGIANDEELETLSIHERLVDEAHARSPDTARVPVEQPHPVSLEPEVDFLQTEHGRILQERLSTLVAAFRDRSQKAKQIIMQPPPPEKPKADVAPPPPPPKSEDSAVKVPLPKDDKKVEEKAAPSKEKKKAAAPPPPKPIVEAPPPPVTIPIWKTYFITIPEWFFKIPRPASFDPHSRIYLGWLFLVSVCFIYNAIVIPYRAAFTELQIDKLDDNNPYYYMWLICDYFCDVVYILDLIIWKPSIRTYVNGIEQLDKKEIVRKYVLGDEFKLDTLSLLPLDFFYFVEGVGINPLFRLPRLLKILTYWEFLDRVDQVSPNPYNYYFRVLRSFSYMMYLIHVNACFYYYFSYTTGFDVKDSFVYNNAQPECQSNSTDPAAVKARAKCTFPGQYNDYIFCFFFSVSMVTIIGNFTFPGLVWEMLYSTVLWFVGVFIFATIVGQIRDVLKAMTRHEDDFYEVMDAIVEHMHTLKIPKELQDRVRAWLLFNWEQQKTIDERQLLEGLPTKLRSDLAMEVHFGVIHKVALFKEIDKKVIEELLLRLRPTVYLPQDYICKRGEIGKEMYIVKEGMLEVVLPDGRVAVTLGPGSVFGEISLLALAGGNRRTADVRSKGFTNLYTLSKADLNDVMKDYPETFVQLKETAHELMNKGKPSQEKPPTPPPIEVIQTRPPTPEMVRLALNMLKADSSIRQRMSKSAVELTSYNEPEPEASEEEDIEIALATDTLAGGTDTDNRVQTPEPFPDVSAEMILQQLTGETALTPLQKPSSDSDAPGRKSTARRTRSRANEPENASSSDSDKGSRRGSSAAARSRKKRTVRPPSQSGAKTPSAFPDSGVLGLGLVRRLSKEKDLSQSLMPDPQQGLQQRSTRSPKPLGSLTSLKRRFVGAPKVHPIGTDVELVQSPEDGGSGSKPSVFAFETGGGAGSTSARSPKPQQKQMEAQKISTASFSDYEFGTNLSDNFAGVTFSSGTETP